MKMYLKKQLFDLVTKSHKNAAIQRKIALLFTNLEIWVFVKKKINKKKKVWPERLKETFYFEMTPYRLNYDRLKSSFAKFISFCTKTYWNHVEKKKIKQK